MSSEMVERVARAICQADGYCPDDHIIGGQATGFEDFGPRWQANLKADGQLGVTDYVELAIGALDAMRNPPPSVFEHLAKSHFGRADVLADFWSAAITAALGGE